MEREGWIETKIEIVGGRGREREMDAWMDKWMDEWTDGQLYYINRSII